jgi:hypothetical protein
MWQAWHVHKDTSAATAALRSAVQANDALPYLEPPRWYYPPRQCLGAMLLSTNATEALEAPRGTCACACACAPS